MTKQNTTIKLKPEQIEELKTYGKMGDHWPDVIEKVLKLAKQATNQTNTTYQTDKTKFKEVNVDAHGKASFGRTLAGRKIEYRIKQ